jgi:hypothetical protein
MPRRQGVACIQITLCRFRILNSELANPDIDIAKFDLPFVRPAPGILQVVL